MQLELQLNGNIHNNLFSDLGSSSSSLAFPFFFPLLFAFVFGFTLPGHGAYTPCPPKKNTPACCCPLNCRLQFQDWSFNEVIEALLINQAPKTNYRCYWAPRMNGRRWRYPSAALHFAALGSSKREGGFSPNTLSIWQSGITTWTRTFCSMVKALFIRLLQL